MITAHDLVPGMGFSVRILADSVAPCGKRLTTWELTYPRFVHSELLTHRVFSRNSASSRAIPASKLRERCLASPAAPVWWGANQKGMQAEAELPDDDVGVQRTWSRPPPQPLTLNAVGGFGSADEWGYPDGRIPKGTLVETPIPSSRQRAKEWWLRGLELMAAHHEEGEKLGLHKQIVNRVIEPWMLITVIVSGTEFEGWFRLRNHEKAQPEIRGIAREMRALYDSTPRMLDAGEWHRPLIYPEDLDWEWRLVPSVLEGRRKDVSVSDAVLNDVSVGRCARVSYLTHDGKRDQLEDLGLAHRLMVDGHWSPFEHVAQALEVPAWSGPFQGFRQYRELVDPNFIRRRCDSCDREEDL